MPYKFNPFTAKLDYYESGGGTTVSPPTVANYAALPLASTVSGQIYWVINSQGTNWLPGTLGGTYYPKGIYYSDGVNWSFIDTPYQATQAEVNTGTNTDKFVTPETLANTTQLVHRTGNEPIGGNKTFTGNTIIDGNLVLNSTINNSLTGSNARIPSHTEVNIRFTNAGLTSIGSANNGGVNDGHILVIANNTGATITITNNFGGASAGEAIFTGTGADRTLLNNAALWFQWNSTSNGWIVVSDGGITAATLASTINSATSKATPVDADELPITDSAASFGLKKLTWANLKATLSNLFLSKSGDTITGDIGNTGTGFFRIPSGTTAQRPGTPLEGMRRYNTTTLRDEFYANGAWRNHARLEGDTFTGAIAASNLSGTNTGDIAETALATIQNSATTESTTYVSPRRFWSGITQFLTNTNTFSALNTFSFRAVFSGQISSRSAINLPNSATDVTSGAVNGDFKHVSHILSFLKNGTWRRFLFAEDNPSLTGTGTVVVTANATGDLARGNGIVSLFQFVQTTAVTVTAATLTSILTGTVLGSTTLNASTDTTNPMMVAGKSFKAYASGIFSSLAAATFQIEIRIGSVVLLDTGALTMIANATEGFKIEVDFDTITSGVSGTMQACVEFRINGQNPIIRSGTVVTIDTTANRVFDVRVAYGATNASNTITVRQAKGLNDAN